jgi:hypothetical protein
MASPTALVAGLIRQAGHSDARYTAASAAIMADLHRGEPVSSLAATRIKNLGAGYDACWSVVSGQWSVDMGWWACNNKTPLTRRKKRNRNPTRPILPMTIAGRLGLFVVELRRECS